MRLGLPGIRVVLIVAVAVSVGAACGTDQATEAGSGPGSLSVGEPDPDLGDNGWTVVSVEGRHFTFDESDQAIGFA